MLHRLENPPGAIRRKKRKGRGPGNNLGKTAGRGTKGQYARSKVARAFEGGQTPMRQRLPMRGFKNPFKKVFAIVNVGDLDKRPALAGRSEVDPQVLAEAGLVRGTELPVKVLGDGEITRAITVKAHQFSRSAQEKLKAAGGEAVILEG